VESGVKHHQTNIHSSCFAIPLQDIVVFDSNLWQSEA
jgi:hypothetical protein